jgi:hypothetical protein
MICTIVTFKSNEVASIADNFLVELLKLSTNHSLAGVVAFSDFSCATLEANNPGRAAKRPLSHREPRPILQVARPSPSAAGTRLR